MPTPAPVRRPAGGDTAVAVHSSHTDDGSGPTFVLVHGLGMSHRYLARLHASLARAGTVHSVDLPGFGGLRRPRRALPVEDLAIALAAALDRLRTGPSVL